MLDDERDVAAGARNLLIRCGGLSAGDSVLIVREPPGSGIYGDCILSVLEAEARNLGLVPIVREEPFQPLVAAPSAGLISAMQDADLTVFLARLGDQNRYQSWPSKYRALVCYALDAAMLGSTFGRLDHLAMIELRDRIDTALASAREITITCPAGTDLHGTISDGGPRPADTNTVRFPLSVHTPVPAASFSGRVMQVGFLVGTGSKFYEPYAVGLRQPISVQIEGNRITDISGDSSDVENARGHYAEVANRFGIDETFVHSWHAGIHPGCAYTAPASAGFVRWSSGAFGNPRLLHFHTCGTYAPGEISLNVLDPTVRLDGVPVWEVGRLYPERIEGGAEVLAANPDIRAALEAPAQDCGAPSGTLSYL